LPRFGLLAESRHSFLQRRNTPFKHLIVTLKKSVTVIQQLFGSVANAVRYLIKAILTGDDEHLSQICETSAKSIETLRGQIVTDRGLGAPIILKFMNGVAGMNESSITEPSKRVRAVATA
jgi:hypothetical protein